MSVFKTLKTQVKLILNFTRNHTITRLSYIQGKIQRKNPSLRNQNNARALSIILNYQIKRSHDSVMIQKKCIQNFILFYFILLFFSSNSALNYGKKPSFISQSASSNFALYVIKPQTHV
jgi:hypothetical protein